MSVGPTAQEAPMQVKEEWSRGRARWLDLTLYERFEHVVVLVLTGLIAIVIVAAIWNLAIKILFSLIMAGDLDPTEYAVFQSVFGMIFTVMIALEFKRSLLIVTERKETVIQARAVLLLALLAIVRKLIILDVAETDAMELIGLAAAILALGCVYWLIRSQDRR